jgi:hypothetical protein
MQLLQKNSLGIIYCPFSELEATVERFSLSLSLVDLINQDSVGFGGSEEKKVVVNLTD